jgi:alpha-1,2-mannosyltransferase
VKTPVDSPWLGQLVMIGVVLVAVSPRYPWYALLLVPFVALTGRWEWLAIPLALLVRQLEPYMALQKSSLATAVLLILLVSIWRAGPGWSDRLAATVVGDARRVRQLVTRRPARTATVTTTTTTAGRATTDEAGR